MTFIKLKLCDCLRDMTRNKNLLLCCCGLQMYERFEFPLEVQRWIVRKRLVSDKETLSSTRVKSDDELYLYLVPASTVGVTKESARATYLGISQQCLFSYYILSLNMFYQLKI